MIDNEVNEQRDDIVSWFLQMGISGAKIEHCALCWLFFFVGGGLLCIGNC